MDDLDKMARELLAAEYDADSPDSITAERLRIGLPVMWWGDDLALRAIRTALLAAPPGFKLVPVDDDNRHRQAAARLGSELAHLKGEVRHLQSVLGRLMQDGRLLDELERAWFFQPPAERVRLASDPCWAAGQHSSLREALRSALLAAAPEVKR